MVASNRTLKPGKIHHRSFLVCGEDLAQPVVSFLSVTISPWSLRNLGWKYIFSTTIYPLNVLINLRFLTLLFQEVLLELNKVYYTIIQLSAVTFSTTVQNCRNLYIT